MAEARGWTAKEVETKQGLAIRIASPIGKYGDWAIVLIYDADNILTQHSYHEADDFYRGLWNAKQALRKGEQWRYRVAGFRRNRDS
jgi:hypothetical protein